MFLFLDDNFIFYIILTIMTAIIIIEGIMINILYKKVKENEAPQPIELREMQQALNWEASVL